MAVLPIVRADNPVLREKAKKVTRVDQSINKLIDDMIETMHAANGVGLAAPQVGVSLRLIVVQEFMENEVGELEPGQIIVLLNPEIVKTSGEYETDEGCLSLPGYVGTIKRAEKVTVKGLNRQGKEVRIKAEGLLAEAFQHEVDHVNGILFFDHLPSIDQLRRLQPRKKPGESEEL
ncbi:MAG: peptide deformylase [Chloroflexi bacterium]|nr:peptide deformylase [Chloroflexota bacterium]MDA8188251.1 peptide deformylase [Dehalococcoidales bacterium]